MIDKLSLDALRSFVALAEELHFTRAAARVHIAQPALTKRIQQLERSLGVTLFVRTRRAVRLAPEATALVDEVRAVLRAADALSAAADRLRHRGSRQLRIGFTPSAPHHVLPKVIAAFRRASPDVACTLIEAGSDDQIQQLLDDALDVGILRPPIKRPRGLVCTTFLEEPFVAVLGRADSRATHASISLTDLSGDPFVLISRRTGATVHDQVLGACANAGFTPRIAQEATTVHAIIALVAAGCGVSILPASAADIGVDGVVLRPLHRSALHTVMAVAYSRARKPSAPMRLFVDTALNVFKR